MKINKSARPLIKWLFPSISLPPNRPKLDSSNQSLSRLEKKILLNLICQCVVDIERFMSQSCVRDFNKIYLPVLMYVNSNEMCKVSLRFLWAGMLIWEFLIYVTCVINIRTLINIPYAW